MLPSFVSKELNQTKDGVWSQPGQRERTCKTFTTG